MENDFREEVSYTPNLLVLNPDFLIVIDLQKNAMKPIVSHTRNPQCYGIHAKLWIWDRKVHSKH